MAEEKHDAPAAEDGGEAPKKGGGGILGMLTKTPVLVGGAMAVEAVAVFVGVKLMTGSPEQALADEVHLEGAAHEVEYDDHGNPILAAPKADIGADVLIDVAELRAHNTKSGRHYLFDVTFYAVVKSEHAEDVKQKIETYKPLIQDRGRTIIGGIDPEKLSGQEPALDTLRRKMRHELEQIVGHDVVKEIVVPRCVPFRIDY